MGLKERFSSKTRGKPFLSRDWPKLPRKAKWYLFALELIGLVPMLAITALAQPDLYRTDLWRIGFNNGLNSNPNMILYAYANHRPLPQIPLIWSQTLTDFNVAIAVVSLFFLLAKLVAFIMKFYWPLLAVFINICFVALFTVSTYGQIGPDYADSRYPSPAAWYFRYGCDLAKPTGSYKSCQIAQGSLAITMYMLMVYTLDLGFAITALVMNKKHHNDEPEEEDAASNWDEPKNVEMHSMKTPVMVTSSPFTPRTQAFHTLDRQLPLRQDAHRYG